jgi:hypothetical protein
MSQLPPDSDDPREDDEELSNDLFSDFDLTDPSLVDEVMSDEEPTDPFALQERDVIGYDLEIEDPEEGGASGVGEIDRSVDQAIAEVMSGNKIEGDGKGLGAMPERSDDEERIPDGKVAGQAPVFVAGEFAGAIMLPQDADPNSWEYDTSVDPYSVELVDDFVYAPNVGSELGDYDIPLYVPAEGADSVPDTQGMVLIKSPDGENLPGEWVRLGDLHPEDRAMVVSKAREMASAVQGFAMSEDQHKELMERVVGAAKGMANATEFARAWDSGNVWKLPLPLDGVWTLTSIGTLAAVTSTAGAISALAAGVPVLGVVVGFGATATVVVTAVTMEVIGTAIPVGNFLLNARRARLPLKDVAKGLGWQAIDVGIGLTKYGVFGIPAKALYDPSTQSLRDFSRNFEQRRRAAIEGGLSPEEVSAATAEFIERAETADAKARYTRGWKRKGAELLTGMAGGVKTRAIVGMAKKTETGKSFVEKSLDFLFPENALESGLEPAQIEGPVEQAAEVVPDADAGVVVDQEKQAALDQLISEMKERGLLNSHQIVRVRLAAGQDIDTALNDLQFLGELEDVRQAGMLDDLLMHRLQSAANSRDALNILTVAKAEVLAHAADDAIEAGSLTLPGADRIFAMMERGELGAAVDEYDRVTGSALFGAVPPESVEELPSFLEEGVEGGGFGLEHLDELDSGDGPDPIDLDEGWGGDED